MMRQISSLLVVLALLVLVGAVSADGGINGAANGYMGGDSLFCNSSRGCWLLNEHGVLLGEFPQADIQAALETCAASAANVIIGTIDGTHGPFTLSAVYDGPNADPVCSLQVNGSEDDGKEARPYVFKPKADGSYSPIPKWDEEAKDPVWVPSPCSGFDIGDPVVWLAFPNNGYEIDNWGTGDTVLLKRTNGTDDVLYPPEVSCNDIVSD